MNRKLRKTAITYRHKEHTMNVKEGDDDWIDQQFREYMCLDNPEKKLEAVNDWIDRLYED
jgi:hypothetical protein